MFEVRVKLYFNSRTDAMLAADWLYTSSIDGLVRIEAPVITNYTKEIPE